MKALYFVPLIFAACTSVQTGSSPSFGGPLSVEARISGGKITEYSVSQTDSPVVAGQALPIMEERILGAGHPMVDAATGASITSWALIRALAEAQRKDIWGRLRLAFTLDVTTYPTSRSPRRAALARRLKPKRTLDADIVVVGSGAAGMAAALSAKEQAPGLSVILLEKLEVLGGNAKFARNLFDIVQSEAQLKAGIGDRAEDLYADTLARMQAYDIPVSPARLRVFAEGSAALDGWLRAHGITLDYLLDSRGIMAGEGAYAGKAVMEGLEKALRGLGVTIMRGAAVEGINFSKKFLWVESREAFYTIRGQRVILAAGGFAANHALVAEQDPELEGLRDSNSPGNTGDILLMASNRNLPLDGMDYITVFNYALPSRELTGDAEEGTEYILLNQQGDRFIDEYGDGDIAQSIRAQEGSYAYLLFDEQALQSSPRLRGHIHAGRGYISPDAPSMAQALGAPSLPESVDAFNKKAEGRRPLRPPFYALRVSPLIHMTRGGLRVDERSRLLDRENRPVQGFYAAGEVTDMPFAALLGSLVFGIDAGRGAAASLGGEK